MGLLKTVNSCLLEIPWASIGIQLLQHHLVRKWPWIAVYLPLPHWTSPVRCSMSVCSTGTTIPSIKCSLFASASTLPRRLLQW